MSAVREKWGNALPVGALPAGALLALVGCTQVTVHAGDGSVSEAIRFGIVSVRPHPGTTAQIVDLQGVGLVAQNGGLTLGYLSSSVALLPADDCRVVIWNEPGQAPPAALTRLLEDPAALCPQGP